MVGPVDGAGVGRAIGAGVFLSYMSAGRRGRILEGIDTVNLPIVIRIFLKCHHSTLSEFSSVCF